MPAELPRERATVMARELERLARGAGLVVSEPWVVRLPKVAAATYLGKGQVDHLRELAGGLEADVVIFNNPLSPVQQRNLERALERKVVDRTGLILEIFAARARSREGRLQVALASLLYQQSRLVRSWTHLERQRGGVGLRGGPGETQIEVDRRLARDRIQELRRSLEKVVQTRELHRQNRQQVPFFAAALVGYTNAGKSALFNRLTGASVQVADQLFATLDPTMRGVTLPSGQRIILSDTVGFIRDLPHPLVAAFRATLEEVMEADLLLHVVDLSDPEWEEQSRSVLAVLEEMGAGAKPILTIMNKADLIDPANAPGLTERLASRPDTLVISTLTGQGIPFLLEALSQEAGRNEETWQLHLPVTDGAILARFNREGRILQRTDGETHIALTVALTTIAAGRLAPLLKKYVSAS
ncbi:MAG: GTPase HflX [Magnetococcales bacterium]|nr:GTPase HflX [Magnetococcales bacterium]MBF0155818.1 GTPase HflX [Magnetococcales bacterium]